MKSSRHLVTLFVLTALAVGFSWSCEKPETEEKPDNKVTKLVETGEASNVTRMTASLNGFAYIDDYSTVNVQFGFVLSTNSNIAAPGTITVAASKRNSNDSYQEKVQNLFPGEKYYYAAYVLINGKYTYGDTKSFTTSTTPPITSKPAVLSTSYTSAQVSSDINIAGEDCTVSSCGFLCSQDQSKLTVGNSEFSVQSKVDDFKAVFGGLKQTTTYYVKSYVSINGKEYYSEVNQFSTKALSDEGLSVQTSANCYIVKTGKNILIPLTKGNSSESIGDVSTVAVLWESNGTQEKINEGDVVGGAMKTSRGIVIAAGSVEGNAVICAKNSAGTILWSWHIWVTNADLEGLSQKYKNNAGTMMDRNLGALSAEKGDIRSLGLLYQWGRKDPFIPSKYPKISCTQSEFPLYTYSDKSSGTIAYAIQNPTTFIKHNVENDDWLYTGNHSVDNTRWKSGKGMYDPCPAGWSIPYGGENGIWARAAGTHAQLKKQFDHENGGMDFQKEFGTSGPCWYPAAGGIDDDGSFSYGVGYHGEYWTYSPSTYKSANLDWTNMAYGMDFRSGDCVEFDNNMDRARANSVRCVKR